MKENTTTPAFDRNSNMNLVKCGVVLVTVPLLVYAYATGPDPRKTGAPGDGLCTEAGCHVGTANSGSGKVEVTFPNGLAYTPGVQQHLTLRITDSAARLYGFQLTARLASNLSGGQAGDLSPSDATTQVLCDDGSLKASKGCNAAAQVQFIEHSQAHPGNTYSFDWTPPATNVGNVRIYVAGNAANGNGQADSGDHIYTANYVLTPAAAQPPPTPPSSGPAQTISQIADGAGWKTTIILTNTDSVPASYTLRFWKGDGTALTLPLGANGSGVQQVTGTIAVNGSQTFATPGTAAGLAQGWGELVTSNSIGGTAIFHSSGLNSEASVALTTPTSKRVLLPFDNTQGFVTSLAMVNPDAAQTAAIAATLYDESGTQLGTGSLTLAPHGQVAFALTDKFSAAAGKRGVAQFSTPNTPLTGLGLRFAAANTFTSVEFLTPPTATASSAPMISQLVRRTGWRTTLMLVNTDAAPSVFTVRFRNMDGTTLAVPLQDGGTVTEVTGVIPANGARFIETDDLAVTEPMRVLGWAELTTPNGITAATVIRGRLSGAESEQVVPFRRMAIQ